MWKDAQEAEKLLKFCPTVEISQNKLKLCPEFQLFQKNVQRMSENSSYFKDFKFRAED